MPETYLTKRGWWNINLFPMTTTFIIYGHISMNNSKDMSGCNKIATQKEPRSDHTHLIIKLSRTKQLNSFWPLPTPPPGLPSSVRKEAPVIFIRCHTHQPAEKTPLPGQPLPALPKPPSANLDSWPWPPQRLPPRPSPQPEKQGPALPQESSPDRNSWEPGKLNTPQWESWAYQGYLCKKEHHF